MEQTYFLKTNVLGVKIIKLFFQNIYPPPPHYIQMAAPLEKSPMNVFESKVLA